jgi:hypothetical protein
VLVVDYHKGAHDLFVGEMRPDGTQAFEATEFDRVFQFDLVAPTNVRKLGLALPLVPPLLCPEF